MMVTMAEVMCVAYFLWRDGYGKAAIVSWEPVQAALAYRDQVGRDTGLWAFDDNAYALLCNVLMLHDQQLGSTPLYALKKANDQLQQHASQ